MNIENEMWDKLKAEIKAELRKELKDEILLEIKEDFQEIVKEEIWDLIFNKRHYELEITTYIQSLCYKNYHYLVMLNEGLVTHGESYIEMQDFSKGSIIMAKKSGVDTNLLYDDLVKMDNLDCSYDNFRKVVNFDYDSDPIIWNDNGKKRFTYKGVFKLYSEIYNYDFSKLNRNRIRLLAIFIGNRFKFEGVHKDFKEIEKSFLKAYPKNK